MAQPPSYYLRHDLQDADDIRILVDGFYVKVQADPILAPIFNDVAKVDWSHHLPVMCQFWESLLFHSGGYAGNPFLKHVVLPVGPAHFERWLSLFLATVDEHFSGPKADEAKLRAHNIANFFQSRINRADGTIPFQGVTL